MVLGFARDLIFLHQVLGVPARVFPGEGVVEPVAKHAVVKLAVAQPITPATAAHEVRRLIHALHAAGDRGVRIAEQDLLRSGDNRLRPRAADAVHGHGRDRHWQAGLDRRLAGGIHLGPGLNDIAHRDGLDLVGPEPGPFDRGADGDGAKVRRRHVLQGSAKGADRRADGFRDHHRT